MRKMGFQVRQQRKVTQPSLHTGWDIRIVHQKPSKRCWKVHENVHYKYKGKEIIYINKKQLDKWS